MEEAQTIKQLHSIVKAKPRRIIESPRLENILNIFCYEFIFVYKDCVRVTEAKRVISTPS